MVVANGRVGLWMERRLSPWRRFLSLILVSSYKDAKTPNCIIHITV